MTAGIMSYDGKLTKIKMVNGQVECGLSAEVNLLGE